MKLDKLIAFIKLRDKLISKERIIFNIWDILLDTRYLLNIYNIAALLGKYTWNILEIFRRLIFLGLVYYRIYILSYSLLYSSFLFLSFKLSL
jgi:hypothetical protein